MTSLCPALTKKYSVLVTGMCPSDLQNPRGKVIPISVVGSYPFVIYGKEKEWFLRKAYTQTSTTCCAKLRSDSQFYVSATMDSTHKSVVSVTLLPEEENDLAPSIRDFVNKEN